MSVPVERGATWTAGNPTKLFDGQYFGEGAFLGRAYDVSPDGQRFLMIKPVGGSDQAATAVNVVVVQHWTEELKRLVPGR